MIVTDQEVQAAWDLLRGEGRSRLKHWTTEQSRLEHRRHVVLAFLTLQSDQKTQGAKEAEARASEKYQQHIEQLAKAEGELAAIRAAMTDARKMLDHWQTQSANMRAAARVT